ncbi:YceK/YidQ family lipoprotein [Pseudomonas gingeri]|nr:YceK/YidQ family lipoprotein [Pseudomonas gingeri]
MPIRSPEETEARLRTSLDAILSSEVSGARRIWPVLFVATFLGRLRTLIAAGAAMILVLLTGCGTTNTVFLGDEVTGKKLNEWKTDCRKLPRVYSGLSYDLCVLFSSPTEAIWGGRPTSLHLFPFLDAGPSIIADTLLLPYTIYRQHKDGSIQFLNSKDDISPELIDMLSGKKPIPHYGGWGWTPESSDSHD